MVKVEIVEEKDQQLPGSSSPYASSSSSRTSSSASLSSVSSQLSADESFLDRIAALVDIVPPSTRHALSSKLSKATSFVKRSGKIVGNVVWIVTTSALLVGLPLALSLEDEAKIVAQEKEMLAQQQGAQQVCNITSIFSSCYTHLIRTSDDVPRLSYCYHQPGTKTLGASWILITARRFSYPPQASPIMTRLILALCTKICRVQSES
jgi:import receptor subunit TOM22